MIPRQHGMAIQEDRMDTITFTKTAPPEWLLAMWKEIDDKTFGKGFDCFAEDAVCNLGVADWQILLQKSLMVSAFDDSLALTRFAAEAIDDGAAQSRSKAAFLFILPRGCGSR
jgi:hypothetical protein